MSAPDEPKRLPSKTALGRLLLDIRERAVKSGVRLLTDEELREETARRDGEHD